MAPQHTLDYWFDYSCPYAYLGSTKIEALASRIDASLAWRPMLLGGVFAAIGTPQNLMNALGPAKAAHNARDMARWAELYEVPLRIPPEHPRRTVEALRATLLCDSDPAVIHGFFRAYWVEGREPSALKTIRSVVSAAGHDADRVVSELASEKTKAELRARTDEAIALGVFGAPAMVLDKGPLFWGQDTFPLVVHAAGLHDTEPSEARPATGRTVELYWDFSSPFAYLATRRAEELARRTGAKLVYRPVLLGGLFRLVGQADVPLFTFPEAKQRYYGLSMNRWAEYLGAPFSFPAHFPLNSVRPLRAWLALPEEKRAGFMHRAFRAYWAEGQNLADEGVLRALLVEQEGVDADEVLARTNDPAIKQALIACTQRAADAGVFGAPTWVVDETELYWGQDRAPLVERKLRGE